MLTESTLVFNDDLLLKKAKELKLTKDETKEDQKETKKKG